MEQRIENGYFFYRTAPWPCGKEFILIPAGVDEKGRALFVSEKVYEELPYNKRDYKPLDNANGAPKGYKWYAKNVSRFSKDYDKILVKE